MIGTNLSLSLPTLSDTYSVAIAKVATALSAIQTSIADKATPSALNINTALDLGGNAITNLTSVQLASGNSPSVPGSVFYFNGEFFLIDATGTIQLTSAGAINVAGVGGIGGDYGGVNPAAVTYDDASGQYRFTQDVGVWADLVAANLILEGAAATVKIGVDSSLASSRILNIKSLPSSGVGLIVYNSATSTIEDAALTNPGATTFSGVLTATDFKYSGTKTLIVGAAQAMPANSYTPTLITGGGGCSWVLGATTNPIVYPVAVPVGARITGWKLYANKATNGSTTLSAGLYKTDSATGTETTLSGPVTTSAVSPGYITTLQGSGLSYDVAVGFQYYVKFSASTTAGTDRCLHLEVTYTTP